MIHRLPAHFYFLSFFLNFPFFNFRFESKMKGLLLNIEQTVSDLINKKFLVSYFQIKLDLKSINGI